jgi:fluoroquinolone transport system permease protein
LWSKTATLTMLAAVESLFIVILTYGTGFRILYLVAGMMFMSVIYTLIGIVLVSRYDSINEYLMPSPLFVAVLQLPWISYFGILDSVLFYVVPTQGPLLLLKGAFAPLSVWETVYAVVYSLVWVVLSYVLAKKSFYRFIIKPKGGI